MTTNTKPTKTLIADGFPLTSLHLAAAGRKHAGNPIPKERYLAARDVEEAHSIKMTNAAQVMPESIRSILVRCRNFIDTTTVPAYPAGADLADEIDALLAAQGTVAQQPVAAYAAVTDERVAFEEMMRSQTFDSLKRLSDGNYESYEARVGWMAWNARASHGQAPATNPWRDAVVNACMPTEACFDGGNPTATIKNLIDWHLKTATPQADRQPTPVQDYPPLPESIKYGQLDHSSGAYGYRPQDMRAYVDADRAARAPADSGAAPAGGVVAYLDIGAGGYLDLGTDLSNEALSRLPKGRNELVIAGTYGIDGYIGAPTTQPAPVRDRRTKQQMTAEVLRRMQQQEDGHNKNPFRSLLDRLMRNEGGYSTIEIGQLKYALDGFYGAAQAAHPACKPDMLVNGGALKLALNVLRRAGKDEVADELEKTAQPAC